MTIQCREMLRYSINGFIATILHYSVLFFCLEIAELRSAGFANLLASTIGISLSFLGNRYFVFCRYEVGIITQAAKFIGLYSTIAIMHGGVLYLWTDRLGLNYNIGFVIAVFIQFLLGYFGGKQFVFNQTNVGGIKQ